VQISETETPLHRLETVYRRAMEQLSTADCFLGAFRSILNGSYVTMPAVRASPVAGTTACNGRGLDLGNQMTARPPALLDLGRYPGAALRGRTPHS
jgi:hypothetical protein